MASDVEPAKKFLLPYLQRADELQKHEPLVAYYCRLYAMERGLKIPAKERTKTTNQILVSLMNQLEKDKKVIQLSPDDNLYVEGFALNVFAKADKQDRAGRADLNTAKTFYAASIFLEVLHQFGPLQPDIEQKHKYALWKAADIRKALNEGRKPVPGPPQDEDDSPSLPQVKTPDSSTSTSSHLQFPSTGFPDERVARLPEDVPYAQQPPNANFAAPSASEVLQPDNAKHLYHSNHNEYGMPLHHEYALHPSSYYPPAGDVPPFSGHPQPASFGHDYVQMPPAGLSYPNMPTAYVADYHQSQGGNIPNAVAYPASAPVNADYGFFKEPIGLERTASAPVSTPKGQPYQPPPDKIAEAQKAARFAISALSFDDVPTAMSYLQQSLDLLSRPSAT